MTRPQPSDGQHVRELVGHNIAAERKHKGLSQEDLAQQLGVQRPQLSIWERGRRLPSFSYLYAISLALGHNHDISWLFIETLGGG